MQKKRPAKLFLHRETIQRLESSDLRTLAGGATGGFGCGNTLNDTCKTCTCPPCIIETVHTCESLCTCTTTTTL